MTNTPRSLVCTVLLAGFALVSAHAQSVYEPFDYTVSGTLADNVLGSSTWAALNGGTAPSITGGSLPVEGLANAIANSVFLPGGNYQEALLTFTTTPVSSGTLFYSFALNLTTAPTAASYMFGLATGNTNYAATIWLQASGAGYQLGIFNRSSNATPVYDSTVYALGQTVFIVGSYTFNAGAGDDSSSLWINPSAATFGDDAIPSATVTSTGGTDMTALSQFLIRGANGSPTGVFDELRVGTTWASVTPAAIPEPSTYAALVGALALAGVALRRRSRLA